MHVLQRHERAGALLAAEPLGLVLLHEELLADGPQLRGEAADVLLVGAAGGGQRVARPRQLALQLRHLLALLLLEQRDLLRVQLLLQHAHAHVPTRERSPPRHATISRVQTMHQIYERITLRRGYVMC